MKHAKSITSIAKARKRLYDLQAWAPFVTFTLPFLDGSFQDAASVQNCVWWTEISREWFEHLRLHSHTQRDLGGKWPGLAGSFLKSPEPWIVLTFCLTMTLVFLVQDGGWSPRHHRCILGSRVEERKKRGVSLCFQMSGNLTQHYCSLLSGQNESEHDHTQRQM